MPLQGFGQVVPGLLAHCLLSEIALSSQHFIDLWSWLHIYSPVWNFVATQNKIFLFAHEANFDTLN